MDSKLQNPLPKKAITVWRLYGVIGFFVSVLIGAGLIFLTTFLSWPSWIMIVVVMLLIFDVLFFVIIIPKIRWDIWGYEIREQEIEIQSGLFVVKRTLIPMIRVQHVDLSQGPILKGYNLANVSISTAATEHVIPMLEQHVADEMRAKISTLARVADEDV